MDASFRLTDEVIRDFPESQIRFVVATGLRNGEEWPEVSAAIGALEQRLAADPDLLPDEDDPVVASWFTAYRAFGTNPKRSRPSHNALIRRMKKSGVLPRITPAVDAYNLVCVSSGTPAGAFDLSTLTGEVLIRPAREGDVFVPLGQPDDRETPNPGEVVYAQGTDVLTRHWNHRDADATKVTATSTEVVFILERISADAVPDKKLAEAQEWLAELVRPHAHAVGLATIDPGAPLMHSRDALPT
jgi:DNA/RNA-binding domain of Phe-tRNA-synthetase-like protein